MSEDKRDQQHQRDFDERLAAGKIREEKPAEISWPAVNSVWTDRHVPNRTLLVLEIQRESTLGRNVIGTVRDGLLAHKGSDYSCSMMTFETIWREATDLEAASKGWTK